MQIPVCNSLHKAFTLQHGRAWKCRTLTNSGNTWGYSEKRVGGSSNAAVLLSPSANVFFQCVAASGAAAALGCHFGFGAQLCPSGASLLCKQRLIQKRRERGSARVSSFASIAFDTMLLKIKRNCKDLERTPISSEVLTILTFCVLWQVFLGRSGQQGLPSQLCSQTEYENEEPRRHLVPGSSQYAPGLCKVFCR